MKIGFVFEEGWLEAKDGYYVKVRELYYSLKKHNDVVITSSYFPGAKIGYKKKSDFFKFSKDLDAIIIMAGNFHSDKFTLSPIFNKRKVLIFWILEEPVEEISLLPWAINRNVFINKLRMKIFSHWVDKCFCVSKEIEKYAKNDLGIINTYVLPNGSNPNLFIKTKSGRNVLSNLKKTYKVVWAGAGQYPWQGLDIIISVAKKMSQHNDVIFIIITNQSWVKIPRNLNNLLVLNSVEYEELPSYLNEADLFLCLYKKNFRNNLYNSPMKLFDYMSMGKPIIASALGQMKEIIVNGENGLLTDTSVEDICKKIMLLKKNSALSSTLALNARKAIVNTYNWDKIAARIINEIENIKN